MYTQAQNSHVVWYLNQLDREIPDVYYFRSTTLDKNFLWKLDLWVIITLV